MASGQPFITRIFLMAIEKFIPSFEEGTITHEPKPYTQICNSPLKNCNNAEALGIWCFLQSCPPGWIVNIKHIQAHFNLGKNKVYTLLNYLIETNLLKRERDVFPNGKYGKTSYTVRNGESFNKYTKLSTEKKASSPLPCFPDVDNRDVYINKRKSINKIKIKRESALSTVEFLPNDENVALTKEFKLDIREEMESFLNRHRGKKSQYEFGRWIKYSYDYKNKKSSHAPQNEIRSTVPAWGPGHPTWDSMNVWDQKNKKAS